MSTHTTGSVILAALGFVFNAATVVGQDGYFVRIEAGVARMGATKETDPITSHDEYPAHDVKLAAFDIGRHEVTVKEFAEFVGAGGYTREDFKPFWDVEAYGEANHFGSWKAPNKWEDQLQFPSRPVTGVSWYEAMAFCRWRSRLDGRLINLPTEAQWERAARGLEARRFAWGEKIPDDTLRLNYDGKIGHPAEVGSYPDGNTPTKDPIWDLAGNVLEWCLDRKVSYAIEVRVGDGLRDGRSEYRVVRGGSYFHDGRSLRAACRSGVGSIARSDVVGFRVVRVVP